MDSQITELKDVPESLSKLVINYCDPLFLTERQRANEKNVEKVNGTLTYINYKGQLWGVTNAHVSDMENSQRKLTLYGFGTQPICLSEVNAHGGFRALRQNGETSRPDIAIIKICETVKKVHFNSNSRKSICLDEWKYPDHSESLSTPVAFGFPTIHKTQDKLQTQSPLVLVTGHTSRNWSFDNEKITLHAGLPNDSDYFLSGISGGPIFHAEDRESNPLIIGIVFEGLPSKPEAESPLFGLNNVVVTGYTLTPDIFDGWLRELRFVD